MLHPKCDITTLVKLAVEDAKIASARDVSEACGNVMVEEMQVEYAGDMDIFMPMIPEHLYLVTTEIVANGLRANAERHGPKLGKSRRTLPPVRVTLSCGPEHFYLRISDEGGGIAFENTEKIWKFSYSASHFRYNEQLQPPLPHRRNESTAGSDGGAASPVAKSSRISRQGLPLSRLYARYWGEHMACVRCVVVRGHTRRLRPALLTACHGVLYMICRCGMHSRRVTACARPCSPRATASCI